MRFSAALLLASLLVACSDDDTGPAPTDATAEDTTVDSGTGVDGTTPEDTLVDDAGDTAAPDTLVDATPDTIVDAIPETLVDATPEVIVDAMPEAIVDATADVAAEVGPKAGACAVCDPIAGCESGYACAAGDAGLRCAPLSTTTESCTNGKDDDCDGLSDCADPDCSGKSCGTGCTCTAGARKETSCNDGVDNDGDGKTDCADGVDCLGKPCLKAGGVGICTSSGACM